MVAPGLPSLLLALLERLLALGDPSNCLVVALQVAKILDIPAWPFWKASCLCDRVVHLPNAEEPQVAQKGACAAGPPDHVSNSIARRHRHMGGYGSSVTR